MEHIDMYLLAIGVDKSVDIVRSLNIPEKYLECVQNPERAEKKQYLHLEIQRESGQVFFAMYHTYADAQRMQDRSFKAIVNH